MILIDDVSALSEMCQLPNSLGIDARAEFYGRPRTVEEAAVLLAHPACAGSEPMLVGGGTNLVYVRQTIPGVVLSLSAMRNIKVCGKRVTAGAGTLLSQLIGETVARGLSGLEVLAGIPGTLGGALAQNSGGKYGEIGEVVESVTLLGLDGELERRRDLTSSPQGRGLK